jgi:23S rRNA-/tRNA-specific pseudouridylate synthase
VSLAVLYADNHLLALAKPAGVPTVPDASGDPSLFDLART